MLTGAGARLTAPPSPVSETVRELHERLQDVEMFMLKRSGYGGDTPSSEHLKNSEGRFRE
jgi:hypothetical protein